MPLRGYWLVRFGHDKDRASEEGVIDGGFRSRRLLDVVRRSNR
jgi:hypothetical protein